MFSDKNAKNGKFNQTLNSKSRSSPNINQDVFAKDNAQIPRENIGLFHGKQGHFSKSLEFLELDFKRYQTDLLNSKTSLIQKEPLNHNSESKKNETVRFSLNNEKPTSKNDNLDSNSSDSTFDCESSNSKIINVYFKKEGASFEKEVTVVKNLPLKSALNVRTLTMENEPGHLVQYEPKTESLLQIRNEHVFESVPRSPLAPRASLQQCRPGRESPLLSGAQVRVFQSPRAQNNLRGERSYNIVSSGCDNMLSGFANIRHDYELPFEERRRRCLTRFPRQRLTFTNETRIGWRTRIRRFFRDVRKQIRTVFNRLQRA
ncbi:hypothetical protein TNCV_272131 [Trichonephila clavipes]|nr:hypothetical protein TNCV_272131 [Trichonephila clavipes]